MKKDFPSSLDITVSKCVPAFNVNYGEGTLLVSKKGKILADNGFITDGLPIIYGFDPADKTPGKLASSESEHKNDAFFELISSMVAKENNDIVTVDMSDEHAIIVNYKNGMIFKMGNWNDVEYKLNLADTVMQDETVKGKKGYLTMIGTKQCSFRTSDGPVTVPGVVEPTTEPLTDEYGFPIIQSEHDPKQEEMLNEINNNRGTTEPTTTVQQWTEANYYDDGSQWTDNSYTQQDNQWSADNSWSDQTTQWSDNSGYDADYDNNSENQW